MTWSSDGQEVSEQEEESREARDEDAVVKSCQIEKSFQREPASVHGLQTLRRMGCMPLSPQDLGLWACLEFVAPLPLSHTEVCRPCLGRGCQVYSRGVQET